jgi:hypothetical protein
MRKVVILRHFTILFSGRQDIVQVVQSSITIVINSRSSVGLEVNSLFGAENVSRLKCELLLVDRTIVYKSPSSNN